MTAAMGPKRAQLPAIQSPTYLRSSWSGESLGDIKASLIATGDFIVA